MQFESTPSQPSNTLRARTMLEILDATFRIYRENFVMLITLTAIVVIPIGIINIIVDGGTTNTDTIINNRTAAGGTIAATCFSILLVAIMTLAQTTILNGVISIFTSERQFNRRLSLSEAWRAAQPRLATLAWAYVLYYVVVIVFSTVIGLATALCGILVVLFAIVAYLAITVGAILPPVVLLEHDRANPSISRSIAIARIRFWQIIGLTFLITVITLVITVALNTILVALLLNNARGALTFEQQIITTAASSLINIFVLPITPIAMTLLYYDARIRSEGLDIALQSMGENARPHDVAFSRPTSMFIQQDFINMAILAVMVAVGLVVFGGAVYSFLNILVPGLGNINQ